MVTSAAPYVRGFQPVIGGSVGFAKDRQSRASADKHNTVKTQREYSRFAFCGVVRFNRHTGCEMETMLLAFFLLHGVLRG